ncbi:hypothetical protein O181_017584 [Austropuccinia psidii MF-1]|uniref:Uncharacterized protein n=1 Tax=Austropuccinia psidii MF-1 TaxID=1389203 RepID=A0A9Q3C3N9_9BASI|nr:hypothetical protein [Austropuccinia psidii MF-1]
MPLSSEAINYLHLHNLTGDSSWTFDLAEKLIEEDLYPFDIIPPLRSLVEDIQHFLTNITLLNQDHQKHKKILDLVPQDHWKLSNHQLDYIKNFNHLQKKYRNASIVDQDWWQGGKNPFEFSFFFSIAG